MAQARCVRCGRPVEPGVLLCDRCREEEMLPVPTRRGARRPSVAEERRRRWPRAMIRPSPVQYHATVMVTVVLVLIGLAVWAFLNHRGVGPFHGNVVGSTRAGTSVSVVVSVRNEGSRTARATCTLSVVDGSDHVLATDVVLTPPISPGGTARVTDTITGLTERPASYRADCQ